MPKSAACQNGQHGTKCCDCPCHYRGGRRIEDLDAELREPGDPDPEEYCYLRGFAAALASLVNHNHQLAYAIAKSHGITLKKLASAGVDPVTLHYLKPAFPDE